jgi:hypothetical protein
MIFALAARYEVPDEAAEADALTRVWTSGDEYLTQARELLYLYSIATLELQLILDSSTISCCHALILMAYHGVVFSLSHSSLIHRALGLRELGHIQDMLYGWRKTWDSTEIRLDG